MVKCAESVLRGIVIHEFFFLLFLLLFGESLFLVFLGDLLFKESFVVYFLLFLLLELFFGSFTLHGDNFKTAWARWFIGLTFQGNLGEWLMFEFLLSKCLRLGDIAHLLQSKL